ncbi:MAG: choice-of-anchor D domain-containing protein [Acidobacteriia bacterium]|nr:choice-of-anchor D domain-containing protein [Terriglobia bacterium]
MASRLVLARLLLFSWPLVLLVGGNARLVPAAFAQQPEAPAATIGPLPPGLQPQVDAMWGVLPSKVVRDNFGHFISSKYYCIEVVIGNNSGYALQIATVGFHLQNLPGRTLPTNGYHIARGTLEKGQEVGPRALFLHTVETAGTVATAFGPFFREPTHKANYEAGVGIFSNPFEKGLELILPDTTIRELNRLDDQTLRDGMIIPNNVQIRTVVFFAKDRLSSLITSPSVNATGACSAIPRRTGLGAWLRRSREKCLDQAEIGQVEAALNQLVVVGDQIAYINRVSVQVSQASPLSLSANNLNFPEQALGTTSAAKTISAANTGATALTIEGIAATGDFAASHTCGASVAPQATCIISVTFTPTAAGIRTGNVSIARSGSGSPQTVVLTGTGIAALSFTPAAPPAFANQRLNSASAAQVVQLTNNTPAAVPVAIATEGDFAQTNDCGATVPPTSTCRIQVTFTPTAAGKRDGVLVVTPTGNGKAIKVPLSGVGVTP